MSACPAPPVPGAPAAALASPGGRRRSSGPPSPGETGWRSVADLARVAPRLAFGGPPEWPEEAYWLLGLRRVYGLWFRVFVPLDAGGPLALQAPQTVTITLTATCDIAGAQQIPSDQPGMRQFGRTLSLVPEYSAVRYYTFPGGCVTYRFVLAPGASPVVTTSVDSAVAFMPRSALVSYIRRTEGLALCGRGAACPG